MEIVLVGIALFLAFGNGANDNFKGFATVWGSGILSYRRALALATLATLAGSLLSLVLAQSLVAQFTGRGLVPDAVAAAPTFMLYAGAGAAMTVFAATRAGLPVSTTHVAVGSIAGVGAAAGTLDWTTVRNIALAWIVTLPLAAAIAWLAATLFVTLA